MRVCPKCRSTYSRKTQFCGLDGTRLVERETDPLIGETVGRYKIVEPLGSGASGVVYRANHTELHTAFAVKVIFGDLASDETLVGRLRREAQTASKIRSPYVVNVVDFGTTEAGLTYLAMEYVPGETLQAIIQREAPLPPRRVARIVAQLAYGLAVTHRLGLVHRDVKPSNVMIVVEDDDERAKLLDFGIVRVADGETDTRLTQVGLVVGTPAYMSPEQAKTSEVSFASDLYSLGVVMYELLSGRKPFKGESVASIILKHAEEAPPPLPPSGGLDQLCLALLAKEPGDRPESAVLVAEIALRCENALAVAGEPPGAPTQTMAQGLVGHEIASQPRLVPIGPASATSGEFVRSSESIALMNDTIGAGTMGPRTGARSKHVFIAASVVFVLSALALLSAVLVPSWLSPTPLDSTSVVGAVAKEHTAKAMSEADGAAQAQAGLAKTLPGNPAASPPSAPVPTEVDLEHLLAERGLSPSDLAGLEACPDAYNAWKSAGDVASSEARASFARLADAVRHAAITSKLLEDKLNRLDARVAGLRKKLAKDEVKRFEQRYLDLYRRVGVDEKAGTLDETARDVSAFEHAINSYY